MATPSKAAWTYTAKLKDPRWQKKRLEVLQCADWACEVCKDTKSMLHVHHKQYFKGRAPWEYDGDQLAVLCEACHKSTHNTPDILIEVTSRLPVDHEKWIDRKKAAALLAGAMGLEDYKPDNNIEAAWFRAGLDVSELARIALEQSAKKAAQ
jgi:5-methylcytosine-specific restriction endonuclease McrA